MSNDYWTQYKTAPNKTTTSGTEGFCQNVDVDWPTSYTYEYEERLHRRRKVRKITVICFILAGLGFTALYLLTGG